MTMSVDFHAFLLREVVNPLRAAWKHDPYLRHYRALRRSQFDPPAVIAGRQWAAVRDLLRHAQETVPFYERRFREAGIDVATMRAPEDLRRLQLLTKADIREHGHEMISRLFRDCKLTSKTTSGSTGVSLQVWVDEESMRFKWACRLRSDEWSGWRIGEPVAMIWGNPEYLKHGWRGRLRNSLIDRSRHLDTLKMDEGTMARYAADLARRPPSLIFGHAHSVYLLAEFVRERGLAAIRPTGIITSSMVLHEWQRRVIENVFACKVTNRYGCEEVSLIACECERHEGLHVNCDGVYVELIRDGRPVGPGEPGSVVVTDLSNRAMPIIRYQVGDMAAWAEKPCSCGRGFPLLDRIEGREADYVTTARGELISGISLTENFAVLVPGIAQVQIIQEEINRFTFRVVRGNDFGPESVRRIAELVAQRFGPDARYQCEYVVSIPQEPSGKYRFCMSKVPVAFVGPAAVTREPVLS
jgi:phenylacetate-coenzyme A ligase PaaK-like adenylate-forming protein